MKLAAILIALLVPAVLHAQATRPDVDVAQFDGKQAVSLMGHPALDIPETGTIEFFVAAWWKEKPAYDPIVLAAISPEGPRYAIAITSDKQAIGLQRGEEWDLTEFDFSDGRMHHVAFVVMDGFTDVYINGEHHDSLLTGFGENASSSFHLGSINGSLSLFHGALANLRFWDVPLDVDDISKYRLTDIHSKEGQSHPDFDALVATGDFSRTIPTIALRKAIPGTFGPDAEVPEEEIQGVAEPTPLSDAELRAAQVFDTQNPDDKDIQEMDRLIDLFEKDPDA